MATINHKTISQGRKTIVFGLPWYTVEEGVSPRKAGAALAKEIQARFDLLVERREGSAQFGLASSHEGARAGAISAASIVADIVKVDSWIYVLEIESSIWICSGREGYILPAGDRIYENRDLARRAFQDLNPSSFKKVYLPASWRNLKTDQGDVASVASDIEETDVLDFIEYNAPKWGKLCSFSPVGGILKMAGACVLLSTIGFGGWTFYTGLQAKAPSYDPAAAAAIQARLLAERMTEQEGRWAILDSNKPWQRNPLPGVILETCIDEIRDMPTDPVGYDVVDIFCDGRNVDASVLRSTGYSTWLEEWAQGQEDVVASTNSTGEQGFLSRTLPEPTARGAEDIRDFQIISSEMLKVGQIEGSSVDIATPAAVPVEEEPEYVPFFASGSWAISTRRPSAWLALFRDTPGLTLNTIKFNVSDKTYTMEGELYVPNL